MIELVTILNKYNFPKRTKRPYTTFEEIESQIGFPLPEDYKFYLDNYGEYEELVGPELINLWDIDNLLYENKDTGIFDRLPLTLGIGNNPSNEFIALEYIKNGNYRIVLSPLIDLDKKFHIIIGSSFTDFFVRLDNGKEWFQ